MKKLLFIISIFIFLNLPVQAQEVLQGSVSLVDRIPNELFGSWKVVSVQVFCSNPLLNAPFSVDIWNLSRTDDVITLTNPESGATASVKIDEVVENTVKFTKTSYSDTEYISESPKITINGENFVGTDTIVIKNYRYGKHVSTDTWLYKIKAKKLSGASTQQILKR